MMQDLYSTAIKKLYTKRNFTFNGKKYTLANIIRNEDQRPLKAPWWKGKEASVIAVDMYGNFILNHCSGSVILWEHKLQQENIIAKSVKEFFTNLEVDEIYGVAAPYEQKF